MQITTTFTKNFLTTENKELIAEIVRRSDYLKLVQPEDVITIFLVPECSMVVIRLTTGWARFHKEQFKAVLQQVKTETTPPPAPLTPKERNKALDKELVAAAQDTGISLGQRDYLTFSASLFDKVGKLGEVGFSAMGHYWLRKSGKRQSMTVQNFAEAIAVLTADSSKVAA